MQLFHCHALVLAQLSEASGFIIEYKLFLPDARCRFQQLESCRRMTGVAAALAQPPFCSRPVLLRSRLVLFATRHSTFYE